ncbi:MAG: GtrA family protein [Candidatus Yanofskybacteria bacterium]|nr:GtrA family protein [Candidatus Yanofskybacteria bacterium]
MTKKDAFLGAIIGVAIALLAYPIALNIGMSIQLLLWLTLMGGLAVATPVGIFVAGILARRWGVLFLVAKYGVVGVLNTLLDAGILNLLSFWFGIYKGTPIIFFSSVGFAVAVVNSYFWNRYWVFASRDTQYGREFVQFIIVSVIGLGLNTGLVYLLTTFVTPLSGLSPQAWENVAKAVAIPLSFAWNFAGYKFIVFRQ